MPTSLLAVLAGMEVYEEADAVSYHEDEGADGFGGGEVFRLRKPPLSVHQPDPARWPAGFFEDLQAALNDPLAERALAAGEPDFASVARLLPPLRELGFLGDETILERLEVTPEGDIVGRPDLALPARARLISVGLLDGWLPAMVHAYEAGAGAQEVIQFATAGDGGRLDLWRRLKRTAGRAATFAYTCNGQEAPPEQFYARLLALWQRWTQFRQEGIRLEVPDKRLETAVQGMLILGTLTFRGLLSRYGVGCYDKTEADSFPPAITFLVQSLLAWGHLDFAGDLLGHYLSRYGKADGTVDYYGPAVSEYGQLLALVAEYVRLSGDSSWLTARLALLRPMWQRLIALRATSLAQYAVGDVHRGLIPGLPEADYHSVEGQWEQFYYSGDVWTSRGLREIGGVLQTLAQPGLQAEGEALVREAEDYRQDILASLQLAMAGNAQFVPPGADQTTPLERLTPERHPSYCNYRYWPEMVSAGVLPRELVTKTSAWRRSHGGELLVSTRFLDQMDDWPALHYARGLLETDDVDHYLLLLYGHWAHHCSQGTLSSYEMVHIVPDETGTRRLGAGEVVPCQVMVATMLRWGLVYEERDAEVVWLCRAVPRRWLAPGKCIAVRRVPTRYGKIGFSIWGGSATAAEGWLLLPKAGFPAEIRLRLRAPEGRKLVEAMLDGVAQPIEGDDVVFRAGLAGKLTLAVRWE